VEKRLSKVLFEFSGEIELERIPKTVTSLNFEKKKR
jgi:hypothetical protein